MPLDALIKVDDDNKAVKVKDDPDSHICRHCHEEFPLRKALMKHIFSDVCKTPPIDPDKHAALQGHYDTLLAEHETLRHEVAALKDRHTEDLAIHKTLRYEVATLKDKYTKDLAQSRTLNDKWRALNDKWRNKYVALRQRYETLNDDLAFTIDDRGKWKNTIVNLCCYLYIRGIRHNWEHYKFHDIPLQEYRQLEGPR